MRGASPSKLYNIGIKDGKIVFISSIINGEADLTLDAEGKLVLPPFFNAHFHLDSVLTLGDPRYNESGTLLEGIEIWAERKAKLTVEEMFKRAERALRWIATYGTLWLRTHADTTEKTLSTVKGLIKVREELKGLVNVQVTAFPQDGILSEPRNEELLEKAVELGVDNIGIIPHNEYTREDGVRSIDVAFKLAKKYDKDVDGHVDETDDEQSRFLEVLAAKTIREKYFQRVAAGHATAMHSYNNAYAFKLMGMLKKAQITIVPNPLINIHLQGRFDAYPKRRGMTRVKQLLERGINVVLGHDCIMDPWYPLGVGDMLQALFMAVHVDQMMGYDELVKSLDLITMNGARLWRMVDRYGVEKGKDANLLVMNAKSELDVIRLMGPPLYVIKDGKLLADNTEGESKVFVNGRWERVEFYFI
jgi:cytosine deaminase